MPLNRLHVPSNLPTTLCRAINRVLHDSLVRTCGVNPDDDFCLVMRHAPEDMILHPHFLGERDPAATIVIEIALLSGRTDDQKEALYGQIRQGLAGLGLKPANAIIYLIENNPIDWSFSEAGSVRTVLGL